MAKKTNPIKEEVLEDREGERRCIIIRGPLGEVVVDSSYDVDTLENMARLAREQYSQGQSIPSYCG